MHALWSSVRLGAFHLPNRLALAPMTRGRANLDGTPQDIVATYYRQRASFGLIVTEAVNVSVDGQGYFATPGIHDEAQVEAWRAVSDAVREEGGRIFMQLVHTGRMGHPENKANRARPLAPSAIVPGQQILTPSGIQDIPRPRAMTADDIVATIDDFRRAARNAIEAGMDGVEIDGGNGYLIQQFLAPNANIRTDIFGGSIANRARLAVEVAKAVADEIGPERTGIRLTPGLEIGGLVEGPDDEPLYAHLVSRLDRLKLAYLHLVHLGNERLLRDIRARWSGILLVLRAGRPLSGLSADLDTGIADIVPVGRWGIANPDFVERLRLGAPIAEADPSTFYTGGAKGYIDYPTLRPPMSAVA